MTAPELDPRSVPEARHRTARTVRTSATLAAAAFALILAAFPLAAASSTSLGKGAIGVFVYGYAGGAIVAVLSFAISSATLARSARHSDRIGILVGALAALLLPYLTVYLEGEAPSPSWYVVYLLFLPGGILLGAQIALASIGLRWRDGTPVPAVAGFLAIVGAAVLLFSGYQLSFSRTESSSFLELLIGALGVGANIVLVLWARGEISRGAPQLSA